MYWSGPDPGMPQAAVGPPPSPLTGSVHEPTAWLPQCPGGASCSWPQRSWRQPSPTRPLLTSVVTRFRAFPLQAAVPPNPSWWRQARPATMHGHRQPAGPQGPSLQRPAGSFFCSTSWVSIFSNSSTFSSTWPPSTLPFYVYTCRHRGNSWSYPSSPS